MKRLLVLFLALMLVTSLFSVSVFAEEGVGGGLTPSEQGFRSLEDEIPEGTNSTFTDLSEETYTDGLHLDVYLNTERVKAEYIPEFELELWDNSDNLISTAVGNKENFSQGLKAYQLVFNIPSFKSGEIYNFKVKSKDPVIKHFTFPDIVVNDDGSIEGYEYDLGMNQYVEVLIGTSDYYVDEYNTQLVRGLIGTKDKPITAGIAADLSKIFVILQDENGVPLKKQKATVIHSDGAILDVTSDDDGVLVLDRDTITKEFLIEVQGREAVNSSSPRFYVNLPFFYEDYDDFLVYTAQFRSLSSSTSRGEIAFNIDFIGNSDLTSSWKEFDVQLTNSEGTTTVHTLTADSTTIQGLFEGTYTITTESKYAEVELSVSQLEIKAGSSSTVKATLTPKYTLEVDKDGKSYNFTVANISSVSDKEYKGTKPTIFAVVPGQSLMIQDNDTKTVQNVTIDPSSYSTKFVLGAGIVFGGTAKTPHTGDPIVYLIILAVVFMGLAVFSLYKFRKLRTVTLSVILVASLLLPSFALITPTTVEARITGTDPAIGRPVSSSPKGLIQTSGTYDAIQVGFMIDNRINADACDILYTQVTEEDMIRAEEAEAQGMTCDGYTNRATQEDLENDLKFEDITRRTMFIMAPNERAHRLLTSSEAGILEFKQINGVGQVITKYGKNPLFGDSRNDPPVNKAYFDSKVLGYPDQVINDYEYPIIMALRSFASKERPSYSLYDVFTKATEIAKQEGSEDFITFFEFQLAVTLHNMRNQTDRSISAENHPFSTFGHSFRSTIDTQFDYSVFGDPDMSEEEWADYIDELNNYYTLNRESFVKSYLDLVEHRMVGQGKVFETQSAFESYKEEILTAFREGRLVLVVETLMAFRDNATASKDGGPYAFMPIHDAMKWYSYLRSKDNSSVRNQLANGQLSVYREAELVKNVIGTYGPSHEDPSKVCSTDACKEGGWMTYSFRYYAYDFYVRTLRPETDYVISSISHGLELDTDGNPFGGWGFHHWDGRELRNDAAEQPGITVTLELEIIDEDGNPVLNPDGTPKIIEDVRVPGWGKVPSIEAMDGLMASATDGSKDKPVSNASTSSDEMVPLKRLQDLTSLDSTYVEGSMHVTHNDTVYQIIPGSTGRLLLVDEKDEADIINKEPLTVSNKNGKIVDIPLPTEEAIKAGRDQWSIILDVDTPPTTAMHVYLGGRAEDLSSEPDVEVENKYLNVFDDKGKPVSSHAKAVLRVKALEIDTGVKPVGNSEVPQWRLSRYWDDVTHLTGKPSYATFSLTYPNQSNRNPRLDPTDVIDFRLISPDLSGVPWAYSKAGLAEGETNKKYISVRNTSAIFGLTGDLLAVKANNEGGKTKFASWVNQVDPFDGRIGLTDLGEPETSRDLSKRHTFLYGVNSGVDPFVYSEERRTVSSCFSTEFGTYCNYYYPRYYFDATSHYKPAEYDLTVKFNRYIPKDSKVPNTFTDTNQSTNGLYWETKQSNSKLSVNPEVLMSYDDTSGNTAYAFTAGGKLREIQPVAYNKAQYIDVDVNPSLTGMSTATDSAAKTLATKYAPNKEVVYKGSAVTTDFDVKGQLELKTFALDIGSSALKNKWNPSTTYNTEDIKNEFLARHATKDASGNWQITLDAEGKLVVGDEPKQHKYGGVTDKVVAKHSGERVVTHVLEVRGGQLVGVNGNRDLNSLPQELKDALTRMHIMGAENIFNAFERNQGDPLDESEFATEGNKIRGASDLATGRGWYNEDTTVLVVYEYINTFDLPSFLYVDKIPMEVDDLETPVDKNEFFSEGKPGYLMMTYRINDAYMTVDSSKGGFGIAKSPQYVVPNVSILDTFN